MNMIDHLSGPMAQIASRVGADVSRMDALSQTFGGMAKAGTVMQEMGTQIVGAVFKPVEATFETRRALGELASLGVTVIVGGGDSVSAVKKEGVDANISHITKGGGASLEYV